MGEEREALSFFNLLGIPLCAPSEKDETCPPIFKIPNNSKAVTWLKLRDTGITELWGRCVFSWLVVEDL